MGTILKFFIMTSLLIFLLVYFFGILANQLLVNPKAKPIMLKFIQAVIVKNGHPVPSGFALNFFIALSWASFFLIFGRIYLELFIFTIRYGGSFYENMDKECDTYIKSDRK